MHLNGLKVCPRSFTGFLVALALLPASLAAQAPATISGKVTNQSGDPVSQATVAIPSMSLITYTAPNGTYRLAVPAARLGSAQVEVTARLIGFRMRSAMVTLTPGGSLSQD